VETHKPSKPRRKPAGAKRGRKARSAAPAVEESPTLAGVIPPQFRNVADQLIGWAGTAAELSLGVGKVLVRRSGQRKALEATGALLREAREAAGLTVGELSAAVNLKDPALIDLAESGKAALPFEVLLRLASVLARNDPIPFAMRLTRSYSPQLWRALEGLGVARLAQHAGREREFVNIFRSRDAARQLSDEAFARVLAFTDAAFEMALTFAKPPRK